MCQIRASPRFWLWLYACYICYYKLKPLSSVLWKPVGNVENGSILQNSWHWPRTGRERTQDSLLTLPTTLDKVALSRLPKGVTEAQVRLECARYGALTAVVLEEGTTNGSGVTAYVCYASSDMAQLAVRRMTGAKIGVFGNEPVQVKLISELPESVPGWSFLWPFCDFLVFWTVFLSGPDGWSNMTWFFNIVTNAMVICINYLISFHKRNILGKDMGCSACISSWVIVMYNICDVMM